MVITTKVAPDGSPWTLDDVIDFAWSRHLAWEQLTVPDDVAIPQQFKILRKKV